MPEGKTGPKTELSTVTDTQLSRTQAATGAGMSKRQHTEGDHRKLSRTDAAREAGMSHHQQYQATRIGNIPEAQFNELVDSDNPPTVTALSEIGNIILP